MSNMTEYMSKNFRGINVSTKNTYCSTTSARAYNFENPKIISMSESRQNYPTMNK
jgi:hypothetical protein